MSDENSKRTGPGSRLDHDAEVTGGDPTINAPGNEPDPASRTEDGRSDAGRLSPDELESSDGLPPG